MSITEKQALRKTLAKTRAALSLETRRIQSFAAVGHLLASKILDGARVVSLYAPLSAEADPTDLERHLQHHHQRVLYPRIKGDHLELAEAELASLAPKPPLGIREPGDDVPTVPLTEIDVFIVPGLAFGPRGERLGYGRGYYDRALAEARRGPKKPLAVGFAFPVQRILHVPTGPEDQAIDALVTSEGLVRF